MNMTGVTNIGLYFKYNIYSVHFFRIRYFSIVIQPSLMKCKSQTMKWEKIYQTSCSNVTFEVKRIHDSAS